MEIKVELTRIELVTSCMPCKRSPKLSYSPRLPQILFREIWGSHRYNNFTEKRWQPQIPTELQNYIFRLVWAAPDYHRFYLEKSVAVIASIIFL